MHFSGLLIAHVLKFLHRAFRQGNCFWESIIIGLEDFIAHVGFFGIGLHEVLHHFGHLGIATFSMHVFQKASHSFNLIVIIIFTDEVELNIHEF